jgi:phytoene synthase
VLEDAGRDRVYLPAARLRSAGTDPEALVRGEAPRDAVRAVVLDLLAVADRYYASGRDGLRYIPALPRQAIIVASALYRHIGVRLRSHHGGDALHGRTIVPSWQKAALTARAITIGNALPWPRRPHDAALHHHLVGLPGCAAPRG